MKSLLDYQSLGEAFEYALLQNPNSIGLIEANRDELVEKLSYEAIYQKAVHVSKLLQSNEFVQGDHCGILMSNQSKWNVSGIGVFFSGGVLVPLDYKLDAQEQIKLIKHAKLHTLIIEYPLWVRMMKSHEFSCLEKVFVFVTEAPEAKDIGLAQRWEQNTSDKSFQIKHSQQTDVATIVYSSGTYGKAKGCMLTHRNYLAQGQALIALFPVDQTNTYFSFIPTNHAIDFMSGFFLPIMSNSKTVHQRTLRPEFIASTIAKYQVTHMALVPLLLKNLYNKLIDQFSKLPWYQNLYIQMMIWINRQLTKNKPHYELSKMLLRPVHKKFGNHLKFIFVGGAFCDPDVVQFFYDLGFSVSIGYGLTEAGTVLTVNDLKPFTNNTVGKPLSITKIEIRNPLPNGVGEVWAKGPTIMKGYFEDPTLTNETIKDGWLDTGDLGKLEDNYLTLMGRKKNMIVTTGGKNIYPEDVEHQFENLPLEEFCVLAGSFIWENQDKYRDSLVLVARTKIESKLENLKPQIKQENNKLSDYKRVSYVIDWQEEFPKTATLKIKRPLLAKEISQATNSILIEEL